MDNITNLYVRVDDITREVWLNDQLIGKSSLAGYKPSGAADQVIEALADILRDRLLWTDD